MRSGGKGWGAVRWRRAGAGRVLLVAAVLSLGAACSAPLGSSGRVASDLVCRAKADRADLSWTAVAGAASYRIHRGSPAGPLQPVGTVPGGATPVFVDSMLAPGDWRWTVQVLDAAGAEVATSNACDDATGAADGAPPTPAIADLSCRAKSGKVDLAWTPIAGVREYRVFRAASGAPAFMGTSDDGVFVDFSLADGTTYSYSVRAVTTEGVEGAASTSCEVTPRARDGGGVPPPIVGGVACRAKATKVDVTWIPVEGAASYRVSRATAGGAATTVGQTTLSVFVDFGLVADAAYVYTVESVTATGLAAEPSAPCGVTPRNRDGAPVNHAPVFTSSPTVQALEGRLWWYQASATDPDGDALSVDLVSAPAGMAFSANGVASWTPATAQIGDQVVELRARDALGASATQLFTLRVDDVNRPPVVTSVPRTDARVGEAYEYVVEAFDPDGDALTLEFIDPPPPGMTLDAGSGVIRWTPALSDLGARPVAVGAHDAGGAAGVQRFDVTVVAAALDVLEPKGDFTVRVGETLRLRLSANHAGARFTASPLPEGARIAGDEILFTPRAGQEGSYTVGVEARFGEMRDGENVGIAVPRTNRPPELAPIAPVSLDEGSTLHVAVSATDPDGDTVTLSAPGLAIPNVVLDAVTGQLMLSPDFDQAGHYDVRLRASDGTEAIEMLVAIEVRDASPPAQPVDLVVDPPQSPAFQASQTVRGSVVGQGGVPPAAAALVTGVDPTSVRQGRTADVTLTVAVLALAPAATSADFGAGVVVEALEVLSASQLRVRVRVEDAATLGPRAVRVSSSGVDAASVVAFSVEPGRASLSGVVNDPFTQQPLANARVRVNGASVETTTDAQGRFTLDGVPGGAQQIVFALPNYGLRRLDVTLGPSDVVSLPDPVGLEALARPFSAGGTLPRAARIASVIDRGVGSRRGGLTPEQAQVLVQDTLVVVGGSEFGVLDDAGNQLNPKLEDGGLGSLSALGVRAQALRIVEGHTYSLQQILWALAYAFDWGPDRPSVSEFLLDLQQVVDESWAQPSNPRSAMAIVLFNEGATLSGRAPRLTPETPINNFQAFLLVTSFLARHRATLELSVDEGLRAKGIDPEVIRRDPSQVPSEVSALAPVRDALVARLGALGASALDLAFGSPAFAAGGGVVIIDPNQFDRLRPDQGRTFTRIWEKSQKAAKALMLYGSLVVAPISAVGAQVLIAAVAGSTAGITGATLGAAAALAILDATLGTLLQKVLVGWFLAATLQQLEPFPPIPERSGLQGDKFILVFDPSVTELLKKGGGAGVQGLGIRPELLHFNYELWRFPDALTKDLAKAERMPAQLEPVPSNPKKLQFVVPAAMLRIGANFFRIATLQFVANAKTDRVDWTFDYREMNPDPTSPISASDLVTKLKLVDDPLLVQRAVNDSIRRFDLRFKVETERLSALNSKTSAELLRTRVDVASWEWLSREAGDRDLQRRLAFQQQKTAGFSQARDLVALAKDPKTRPQNLLDPTSQEYKRMANALGVPGGVVPDKLALTMNELAEGRYDVEIESILINDFTETRDSLQKLKAKVAASPPGTKISATVGRFDRDGRFQELPLDLQGGSDPDSMKLLDGAIDEEVQKLNDSSAKIQAANEKITLRTDDVVGDRLGKPDWVAEKLARENHALGLEEMQRQRFDAQNAGRDAITKRQAYRQSLEAFDPAGNVVKNGKAQARMKALGPWLNGLDKALSIWSGITNATDTAQAFLEGIQHMPSDLSAAYLYVNPRPAVASAPPIEVHPNLEESEAFITTVPVERTVVLPGQEKVVGGKLVTSFPGHDFLDWSADMQFPADLVAVDANGSIYALNARSLYYGGRIFRFDPRNGYARELAGTVNYYSTSMQYGRPATPAAMTVARAKDVYGPGPVQDLFVADIDYIANQHRIVQVPVSQIDTNPAFASERFRDRIVGQILAARPEWDFSQVTDLVAGPDEPDFGRLYLSNGASVWLVRQHLKTGSVETQLLFSTPGREWSGLAFDAARNFYFADRLSGDVFLMTLSELYALETSGEPFCGKVIHVGATSATKAVRIAIGHDQQTLAASSNATRPSTLRPLPVLLEGAQKFEAVRVVSGPYESSALKITQEKCPPVFLIEPGVIDLESGRIKLRVQMRVPGTLDPYWVDYSLSLAPFGANVLKVTP